MQLKGNIKKKKILTFNSFFFNKSEQYNCASKRLNNFNTAAELNFKVLYFHTETTITFVQIISTLLFIPRV